MQLHGPTIYKRLIEFGSLGEAKKQCFLTSNW